MRTAIVTAPLDEPFTLEEVRMHLRNPEITTNDDEITRFIQTAREQAEHALGYGLLTQTRDVFLDNFPSSYGWSHTWNEWTALQPNAIDLPLRPVQSITSIKYDDGDGNQLTMADTDYTILNTDDKASVRLLFGKSWPSAACNPDSIIVRGVFGFVDAEFIPASVKNWMLACIEWLDKNRGLNSDIETFSNEYAPRLLDPYRVLGV